MSATPAAFATKDNANSTLASGITATTLTIPLASSGGSAFPQPYQGTATSGGTSTTLNCTSISATIGGSAAVGKAILNFSDSSIAFITAVNTNSLTTTALLGGTTNTWGNGNAWRIDEFVVTFETHDGSGNVTAREEARIYGRSTDNLLVASTGERGYNNTTAQSFLTGAYVYLHVTSPIVERLRDIVSVMGVQLDTNTTSIATHTTNITNLQTGAWYYVVTTGSANAYVAATPALAALAAGNIVMMKANFTNTGSATLNINGLGAKTIKKNDGATNLSANDIVSGQIVLLQYDSTNLQMLSPSGTPTTITTTTKTVYAAGANSTTLTNPTSTTNYDTHSYAIPSGDLVAGVAYEFEGGYSVTYGTSGQFVLSVRLGSTDIVAPSVAAQSGTENGIFRGTIWGTAAAGGSVEVRGVFFVGNDGSTSTLSSWQKYGSANVATNGGLTLQFGALFNTSNGSNTTVMRACTIKKLSTSAFT